MSNSPASTKTVILVADDDEFMLDAILQYLGNNGHEPIGADDGQEALRLFQKHTPELVLLDGRMPVMDGFQVCRAIKEIPKGQEVPIIMVTALEDDASINRAFEAGAEEYVTKPINWTVLSHRIRLILKQKRAEARLLLEITERKKLEEKLRKRAEFDALTALPNRVVFRDRLSQAIRMSERSKRLGAVLFIDLDRFKWVNDALGHKAGDELLIQVAQRLSSCVRKSDTVARFGGDEFIILLPDIQPESLSEHVAQKVLEQLAMPFRLSGRDVKISGSVGVTVFPPDNLDPDVLVKNADSAMYRAKKSGRNAYRFFKEA